MKAIQERRILSHSIAARDAANDVIYSSQTSAKPAGCTNISGASANISVDKTWAYAQSPFCVQDNVTVSAKLTIEPGSVLRFAAGKKLTVQSGGTLVVQGSADKLIFFTGDDAVAVPGYWGGIEFSPGSVGSAISGGYGGGSVLSFAVVEFAGPGLSVDQTSLWVEYTIMILRRMVVRRVPV